ncbi:hypothetical protein [Giesbergeria giesbergeri]
MKVLACIPAALLCTAWLVTIPSSQAGTTATTVPYAGTWKGSIGPHNVMVCLSPQTAQYYSLQQRRGLWLEAKATGQSSEDALAQALQTGQLTLTEQVRDAGSIELRPLAHWQLEPNAQGGLHGIWRDLTGQKKPPIQLTRLPAVAGRQQEDSAACGAQFYAPIQAAHTVQSHPRQYQGRSYQELRTPIARALQLPGNSSGVAAFNAYARQWLGEQAIQDYECTRMGGSTWESTLELVFWTDTTLVLRDFTPELYCGGAHGFSSVSHLTWNLETGLPTVVWDWLQGGAKAAAPQHTPSGEAIRTPLRALLEKHDPRNTPGDDCAEDSEHMEIAQPYPTPQGLVFETLHPHAMRACNDSITLAWRQLQPLLTPTGKTAMQHWRKTNR